jgi:hypothetical protein
MFWSTNRSGVRTSRPGRLRKWAASGGSNQVTGPYRRGGQGFECILHGMNPERILVAAEAVGPRRWAQGSRLCRQGVCRVGSGELAKHLSRQSRVQGVRDRGDMMLRGFGYCEGVSRRVLSAVGSSRIAPISPQLILCYIVERVTRSA